MPINVLSARPRELASVSFHATPRSHEPGPVRHLRTCRLRSPLRRRSVRPRPVVALFTSGARPWPWPSAWACWTTWAACRSRRPRSAWRTAVFAPGPDPEMIAEIATRLRQDAGLGLGRWRQLRLEPVDTQDHRIPLGGDRCRAPRTGVRQVAHPTAQRLVPPHRGSKPAIAGRAGDGDVRRWRPACVDSRPLFARAVARFAFAVAGHSDTCLTFRCLPQHDQRRIGSGVLRSRRNARRFQLPARACVVSGIPGRRDRAAAVAHPPLHRDGRRSDGAGPDRPSTRRAHRRRPSRRGESPVRGDARRDLAARGRA